MVRSDDESANEPKSERSAQEIRESIGWADDKERAIGFIAAPVAAALSFLIIGTLLHNDPAIDTKNYVSPSLYHTLQFVLLGLSVLILGSALWRKRMFIGITMALYGLAVFNLHYWGFGVPYLLAGAWYLVRAYRLQQELKRVEGSGVTSRSAARPTSGARPRPNKRYTPPA
jgi:hypothetical protein